MAEEEKVETKNESWYNKCVKFTDDYDQIAFDPQYQNDTLDSFIGLIAETFKIPSASISKVTST